MCVVVRRERCCWGEASHSAMAGEGKQRRVTQQLAVTQHTATRPDMWLCLCGTQGLGLWRTAERSCRELHFTPPGHLPPILPQSSPSDSLPHNCHYSPPSSLPQQHLHTSSPTSTNNTAMAEGIDRKEDARLEFSTSKEVTV